MREICMLRLRWRELETESRFALIGHEGGNPGYRQGRSYGPPRQLSTLPGFSTAPQTRIPKVFSLPFAWLDLPEPRNSNGVAPVF